MIPETKPALLLASWRTGGTFLSHCLSNHTEIYCVRGEAMHPKSVWWPLANGRFAVLLRCLLSQPHYAVSMCKLTYTQAYHEAVWAYLVEAQPRVIWLRRENVLRQAVSLLLVKLGNKHLAPQPVHSTVATPLTPVELEPSVVLEHARSLVRANSRAQERIRAFEQVLRVTYAEVVGGEGQAAEFLPTRTGQRVCAFLGVPYQRMGCGLKRVNAYPLSQLVSNWAAVEEAVRASEFAGLLEDEWTS